MCTQGTIHEMIALSELVPMQIASINVTILSLWEVLIEAIFDWGRTLQEIVLQ